MKKAKAAAPRPFFKKGYFIKIYSNEYDEKYITKEIQGLALEDVEFYKELALKFRSEYYFHGPAKTPTLGNSERADVEVLAAVVDALLAHPNITEETFRTWDNAVKNESSGDGGGWIQERLCASILGYTNDEDDDEREAGKYFYRAVHKINVVYFAEDCGEVIM